ncbi:unnamed protein product [Blepharisma stoltei]|uniref:Uncharacterized protein n=1 Tax=Blepharisma stoltei TaxID=1481888 RepID=A0AAU9JCA2_9CILI|nr:unnamed protein product [Blepharisma stoltei]
MHILSKRIPKFLSILTCIVLFGCSICLIYIFSLENDQGNQLILSKEEENLNVFSSAKDQDIIIENLKTSLILLNSNNETSKTPITSWPLTQYPELPDDGNVSCIPKSFGYTQEQADKLFDPNRRFYNCADRSVSTEIISIANDTLYVKCLEFQTPEYVLGGMLNDEQLGEIPFRSRWRPYDGPVDFKDREFAFARCYRAKKQAILRNNFNKTASDRAFEKTKKIAEELGMKTKPRPQTVLMILFDSVSRQHFYRNLRKTIESLNTEIIDSSLSNRIVMYDFIINNVQGENTIPNLVPLLYGYNLKLLQKKLSKYSIAHKSHWQYFEALQEEAIWKHYERHGYVTMFGYDTVWDYLSTCTGRKILTDHVATNFWHAARKMYGYLDFIERQRCFGAHHSHWYMLNYANQYVINYLGNNRFGYVHLSPAHESTGTVIRTVDDDLKDFFIDLLYFLYEHPEEDFVIHLMSDHGKHSKEWDKHTEGYKENQLPMHIMITNKELIARLGSDTDSILKHNTKRLVSRFDWYITFKHIALNPYGNLLISSELYKEWKTLPDTQNGVSLLLEKINDDRSCDNVAIPNFLCSCFTFTEIPLEIAKDTPGINNLIALALESMNENIKNNKHEDFCRKVSFKELVTAEIQQLKAREKGGNKIYRIRISINEDEDAIFEIFGYAVKANAIINYFRPNDDGLNPITYYNETEKKLMAIQLQGIERVDNVKAICEEIANQINENSDTCICKLPQELNISSISKKWEEVIGNLLNKLSIIVGETHSLCSEICEAESLSCQSWGFQLLNKAEILKKDWDPRNPLKVTFEEGRVALFNELKISREIVGLGLGLIQNNDSFDLMTYSEKNITCFTVEYGVQPLCPCQ